MREENRSKLGRANTEVKYDKTGVFTPVWDLASGLFSAVFFYHFINGVQSQLLYRFTSGRATQRSQTVNFP
ncbi:hypothetical protein CIAM_45470 (plasmid) [Citrobacter amalonaticus]|nr:hypothetical protein CIAM_45470 [Citrobacter amalonaticus]